MNAPFKIVLFLLANLLILWGCSENKPAPVPLTYSGDSPRVQNPLTPEQSMTHIQVPEGFRVELFASEPEIINPIAFDWDERGRLWVVQSQDYPHKLENDVGGDRVTICEDTDGDGVADKFTDFATEQHLTTGITVVKGGAILAQAPDIAFLEDTDGDDKMDKRTVLFDGFGIWDTHAGPSNLHYGMDNMIWGAVGYSAFKNSFQGKEVKFGSGIFRFSRNGNYFEPIGQFNNNTWGLGFNENFEFFGSTANNNHACYVGIPLRFYNYLEKIPSWGVNADFIQGHYEIHPLDTLPLQQVDVRGGYTAAAGANFYTAGNYPKEYHNQMYVCEPTGYLVHIARIEQDGSGYKETDGGNIFESTDAWVSPVHAETGPDGNLWVADWYSPVIQHNPDKRGMENQIWNAELGPGNAHLNPLRDYSHGRIYRIVYKGKKNRKISALSRDNDKELLAALSSDNMFWRLTAQRIIVEEQKLNLVPDLIKLIKAGLKKNADNQSGVAHALWTLDGLGVFAGVDESHNDIFSACLASPSYSVQRAALGVLPLNENSSNLVAESGLLTHPDLRARLTAILKSGELPETKALFSEIEKFSRDEGNLSDKWLNAALKIYYREKDYRLTDLSALSMILPTGDNENVSWTYTTDKPADDWMKEGFDTKAWKVGSAKFGSDGVSGVRTQWTTEDIWLRKEIEISEPIKEPVLKILHDDDYEVFVNGQLLMAEKGAIKEYEYIKLDDKRALFKTGKNLIAVHCRNTGGPQYIDVGIGKIGKIKADRTLVVNTINQVMEYEQKVLHAKAGEVIEIVLNNVDQMPHNLVVIKPGMLKTFGSMVDEYVKKPEAEKNDYVPSSRIVLGQIKMLNPGENGSVTIKVPDIPGKYPYVCTFPGHWSLMQGMLIVSAPGSNLSDRSDATNIVTMGGGGSHDFLKFFGGEDGLVLKGDGENSVVYTENAEDLAEIVSHADVLYLTNNKPIPAQTRTAIMQRVNEGKLAMMISHPGTWYNWADWPAYNKELVGGGSRSHEPLGEFEVEVVKPDHRIMKGVPQKFKIVDELYRWEPDSSATPIEVLAIGRSLTTGKEYPAVWIVKHPKTKIVGNTLGHDERAHGLPAYKTILKNSIDWIKYE